MKKAIERYVIWLAPALIFQAWAYSYNDGYVPDVEGMFAEPSEFSLFEALIPSVLAMVGYYLPGVVTAIWLVKNSEGSLGMKLVWAVAGFFLEYFALIPFIGSLLFANESDEKRQAA